METEKQSKTISIKEFFTINWWVIRMNMRTSRLSTSLFFVFRSLSELNSLVFVFLMSLIIDKSIEVATHKDATVSDLYVYVLAMFLYLSVGAIIEYSANAIQDRFYTVTDVSHKRDLYIKIHSLGMDTLEDPETANVLARAEEALGNVFYQLNRLTRFVATIIKVIIAGIVVAKALPVMLMFLIIASVPKVLIHRYYVKKDWTLYRNSSEGRRKSRFSKSMLTTPSSLNEIVITNSFTKLDEQYVGFSFDMADKINRIRLSWDTFDYLANLLSTVAILGGFIAIVSRLINGLLSVGQMTFLFGTLRSLNDSINSIAIEFSNVYEATVRIKGVRDFFEMQPISQDGEIEIEKYETAPSISIQNLSFRYPNTDKFVIENLNLEIKPGEKIALVGHNGAGKTTLMKLLTRVYLPTRGKILINGIDLSEIKSTTWYENLSVLFQEYNNYEHLSVKENIAIGDATRDINMKEVKEAAKNADAAPFIEKYKNGYDQVLSEQFKGGIRPSTGQWQKIAIARLFYRNRSIVVLDEPTASIDAVAEYKIFNRIYKYLGNKSVIIISHRFSTVRNADRIIVFADGKVVEEGNHEVLLAKEGEYAHSFGLQAEGYK